MNESLRSAGNLSAATSGDELPNENQDRMNKMVVSFGFPPDLLFTRFHELEPMKVQTKITRKHLTILRNEIIITN